VDTVHECDRRTDGQTNIQTDGQTDRITITKTVQRIASRGKMYWPSSTFRTLFTTGLLTSSIIIPTALYSEANCPHCSMSPQVSSRVQPLDQLRSLSLPETSSLPCRETLCANTPTIRTSSSLPATRRPGLWNSTTCRDGPSRTT